MADDVPCYNTASLARMVENFGERLEVATVFELSERNVIFVEDGNHGENRPRQDEFAATGIAFLRPPDLKDGRVDFQNCGRINEAGFKRVRKGIGQRGDIILTHRATVGRIAITGNDAPEVFVTNPGTTVWRSTNADVLDQRYLYCFMRSAAFMDQLWSQVGNNSTFDYVSLTQQRALRVAFPALPEQRAIASVLGALDDKIELNRRMNETLEALAQSLFKSWFVDATQSALPNGWREGTLREITGFMGGYAFKSKDWIEEGVPVVKIGSVKPGIVDLNEVSFVSNEIAEEAKRFRLSAGDLLIGMTGYVGEVGLVPPSDNLPLLNQRVGKFVLEKPGTAALGFLYCLTRRPEFKAGVEVKSHGTAQANVSPDGILSVPVTIPPQTLMDEFNTFCEPILNQILANHAESRTLAELRDVLVPKLLSGELRVPAHADSTD